MHLISWRYVIRRELVGKRTSYNCLHTAERSECQDLRLGGSSFHSSRMGDVFRTSACPDDAASCASSAMMRGHLSVVVDC